MPIDKIIELICEEARRRPGKRLVPRLRLVLLEVDGIVDDLINNLLTAEYQVKPLSDINRPGVNDP